MKTTISNVEIKSLATWLPSNKIDLMSFCDRFPEKNVRDVIKASGAETVYRTSEGQKASDVCFNAAEFLLDKENIDRSTIDGLVFVSSTRDWIIPDTAVSLQHRSGDDVIRIDVLWLCGCRHRFDLFYRLGDLCSEIRRSLRHDITAIACHEGRLNARAVFINDIRIADNVVHSHSRIFPRKCCETRREKEKRDASVEIKIADLRQDRKRRIIKHDTSVRVVKRLVVSAWIKRAHDTARIDTILLARPVTDGIVDKRRRVAVVRRLFGLKFCDKIVILRIVCKKRRL